MNAEQSLTYKFNKLSLYMTEKVRRLWAAAEAKTFGHGGTAFVSRLTGIDAKTIRSGIKEITRPGRQFKNKNVIDKIRTDGGGRKSLIENHPEILSALEELIDPSIRGDPESPLRWTSKSLSKISEELKKQGFTISLPTIGAILHEMGFSLQSNRKVNEGKSHEDRDLQFTHINEQAKSFHAENQPVISIDTKKKEIIGEFKNNGKEWRPKGKPIKVNTHDFPDKNLGKVAPYGIYDLFDNSGWVNVGISADTAEFSVNSIKIWWNKIGIKLYPEAKKLLITADCGGSNSNKSHLFKHFLQKFSNETKLEISVCHFPPGTSKWNKIEHRMFCHISNNWRGRPLTSHEVVVNTIRNTTTKTGLKINAGLDKRIYQKGLKLRAQVVKQINLKRDDFHGEWNYFISPNG